MLAVKQKYSSLMIVTILMLLSLLGVAGTQSQDYIVAIAWNPTNSSQLAIGQLDGTIEIQDFSNSTSVVFTSSNTSRPSVIEWSSDGSKLAAAHTDAIYIWDVINQSIISTIQLDPAAIIALSWSPDDITLAGAQQNGGIVYVWDTTTIVGSTIATEVTGGEFELNGIAWYGNNLIGTFASKVFRLDANLQYIEDVGIDSTFDYIFAMDVNIDSGLVASGGASNVLMIWDIENTQLTDTFSGHAGAITTIDWHPDGILIASGSSDGTIRIWDSINNQLVQTIDVGGPIFRLQWSPNGESLAYVGDFSSGNLVEVVEHP